LCINPRQAEMFHSRWPVGGRSAPLSSSSGRRRSRPARHRPAGLVHGPPDRLVFLAIWLKTTSLVASRRCGHLRGVLDSIVWNGRILAGEVREQGRYAKTKISPNCNGFGRLCRGSGGAGFSPCACPFRSGCDGKCGAGIRRRREPRSPGSGGSSWCTRCLRTAHTLQ